MTCRIRAVPGRPGCSGGARASSDARTRGCSRSRPGRARRRPLRLLQLNQLRPERGQASERGGSTDTGQSTDPGQGEVQSTDTGQGEVGAQTQVRNAAGEQALTCSVSTQFPLF